jgi:DNA-binding MarR family transcriptional regulator
VNCLCANLRRSARLLNRYYEKELQPAGLTPAQFELLANLSARPGASHAELAAALGLDQTTLSRNIKILIERNWISRASEAKDLRRAAYTLSENGSEALREAMPHWQRANSHMQEALGADWQAVWSNLERLRSATPA